MISKCNFSKDPLTARFWLSHHRKKLLNCGSVINTDGLLKFMSCHLFLALFMFLSLSMLQLFLSLTEYYLTSAFVCVCAKMDDAFRCQGVDRRMWRKLWSSLLSWWIIKFSCWRSSEHWSCSAPSPCVTAATWPRSSWPLCRGGWSTPQTSSNTCCQTL